MGRMKELYINILEANGGKMPYDLAISDLAKMKELEIYEWYEYNRALSKEQSFKMSDKNQLEFYIEKDSIKIRKDHKADG